MKKKITALILAGIFCIITAPLWGCGKQDTTVNFLNWGDYIDPEVIPQFEQENPGIKINMTTVDSNEAMYVATSTAGTDIDVVLPSEYMIQRMMKEDMLAKLDHAKMDNYKYVEAFAKQNCGYDPNCDYSVPYSWGTFGIIYNTTMIDGPVEDWGILFDGSSKSKLLMYDSMRDTLGAALLQLGYSMNTKNPDELNQAAELLIKQKPDVLAYGTDELRMSMSSGSAAIAIMYAGDAVYSMADNPDLEYVIPKGANIFVDSVCILKGTDVYDAAIKFVNFLMKPEIAAKNAVYNGYSTPEEAAYPYIDQDLMDNPAFNPPKDAVADCVYYEHLEPDVLKLYEDAWLRVKTAS